MKVMKELGSFIYTIAVAIGIALCIHVFILQPQNVLGSSMEPNFHNGDRIFVSKIEHTLGRAPDYNDVVIIDSRVERKHTLKDDVVDSLTSNLLTHFFFHQVNDNYWIKRVIGKPGDVLTFQEGKVYRNGEMLQESYIKEEMNEGYEKEVVVPDGYVFVMGDNRNNSMDSRIIGPVPLENVVGKFMTKINFDFLKNF